MVAKDYGNDKCFNGLSLKAAYQLPILGSMQSLALNVRKGDGHDWWDNS